MPFNIVRDDITKMKTDAVVNAANTALAMGGGVCGAIFKAAGTAELTAACQKLAPINTGEAVITSGFNLPAKYIIHAAGPIYDNYSPAESKRLLQAAYVNSMKLAAENGCESIAFPLISSGIYGYPKRAALKDAIEAIRGFIEKHDLNVYLAVFDKSAFEISEKLLGGVESYIDENYAAAHDDSSRRREDELNIYKASPAAAPPINSDSVGSAADDDYFCDIITLLSPKAGEALEVQLDAPFSERILKLIDEKGYTDAEVYKRANIDRKLFSKIRKPGYTPGKRTVLALAIAMKLPLKDAESLLRCAGYALSHSSLFDVIIEYFIKNKIYDIFEINEVLFKYDQPLLGA